MIRIPLVSEYNNKGVKQAQSGIQSLDKSIKDMGKTVVAGFAVQQVFQFGKAAVNAASDLEESANAVSVTFGTATASINQLAEDSVDAYGMSTTEFNTFAVSFSAFAQQIAGDGGDVSAVIDDMGTRIADFASVHNLSLQDAGQKFQSAMAGSSEVVRQYGIDLSAASVEQFALEQGLVSSKSQMTEAIKVQARYGLLMQSTEQFAGDFANTSDSLANASKRLKADMANLQAEIGQELLPAMQGLVNLAIDTKDTFDTLGISFRDVFGSDPVGRQERLERAIAESNGEVYRNVEAVELQTRTYWQLQYRSRQTGRQMDETARQTSILTESQRDAATAGRRLNDETLRMRNEFKSLLGEIDDRDAFRQLYDQFENLVNVTKDFGEGSREAEEATDDLRREVLMYAEALELPPEVTTKILADIDQMGLDELRALLLRLEGGVTLPIVPQLIGGTGLRFDEFGNVRQAGVGATTTPTTTINVVAAGTDAYSLARALERESVNGGALPINTTSAVGQ